MAGRAKASTVAVILALMGCTKDPGTPEVNEFKIGLASIKSEFLIDCDPLGPPPENTLGALAQDQVDIAAAGACWKQRYTALRDLVQPLVLKAKQP